MIDVKSDDLASEAIQDVCPRCKIHCGVRIGGCGVHIDSGERDAWEECTCTRCGFKFVQWYKVGPLYQQTVETSRGGITIPVKGKAKGASGE